MLLGYGQWKIYSHLLSAKCLVSSATIFAAKRYSFGCILGIRLSFDLVNVCMKDVKLY